MGLWPKKDMPDEPKKEEQKAALTSEQVLEQMRTLLNPLAEANVKINERLSAIEESTKKKPVPVNPPEIPSVLDNEDGAFNARIAPVAGVTIELRAKLTERDVLDDVSSEGWGDFLPAIKKELASTPLQVKASENYEAYVRNVVDMVVGREARKGGLKRKERSFVLEDASSSPADPEQAKLDSADKEFLSFKITNSKGKTITRADFLRSQGIDIDNPETLKKVRESWSQVQVVN